MPVNTAAVGYVSPPWIRRWSSSDSLLYALAVGAGPDELALTTENTEGVTQRAVPSYAAVLAAGSRAVRDQLGDWEPSKLVHGSQDLRWHRELPVEGAAELTTEVVAVTDKGSGALVEVLTRAVAPSTKDPLFDARASLFIRGEGGFAPERVPDPPVPAPTTPPETAMRFHVPETLHLLYRLCGDRNRLHSDPGYARRAGFGRPILHGLCTYGVTTRILMNTLAGGDPAQLAQLAGRFRAPVYPGDDIEMRLWPSMGVFEVYRGEQAVLDRGVVRLSGAA